ncbi:MAG: transporter substrate-binding domain-containing protein [Campylobacterota bacterium]|nr:transporter substrate-binding domain-containing protein [Campylobacterota bacterium]
MTLKQYFLFFLITVLSSGHENIILTQDEQEYLKKKKEITLCFSPKGLPLLGYKEGKNIGILPEVISLVEKKIPIPFRYVPVNTWEECIELSQRKKVDIAAVIISSPNQHVHLNPSHKVIDGFIGIATKINEPFFHGLSNLNTQKVAFIKGQKSVQSYVKRKFPNITIVLVDSIEEGLRLVAEGRVYGYADDTYSLAYNILKLYNNELKILGRVDSTPISGSIGVHKDETALLNIINKAVDKVDEQKVRDIIHSWISVRVENSFDYTLLVQIVSFLLLVLIVSFYWVRKLLKEVSRRKVAEQELKNFNDNLEKEISSKLEEIHYKDAMLLEKTKLAAMGEMIGSIAHQWRRPLSTLHINIEMLEEDYKEKKIDKKFLEQFIRTNSEIIQYMSNTINDFQHFYKIDKEKRLFDVMKKIQAVSDLKLNQLEESGISITKEGESFMVLGYPSEFQQVILNLISNAKDALIKNKILNPSIKINLFSDDAKGYIQISDNAGSIDKKILEKVFEPYFTTKEKEGGTGLGLYMSKMIIEKNMNGKLSISNSEEGSEVLIILHKEEHV